VVKLNNEKFDGWFSSIENKGTIEVALINSKRIFKALDSELLVRNWRNGNINNNIISTKNWGTKYLQNNIQ